jgi:hypothetical protein
LYYFRGSDRKIKTNLECKRGWTALPDYINLNCQEQRDKLPCSQVTAGMILKGYRKAPARSRARRK